MVYNPVPVLVTELTLKEVLIVPVAPAKLPHAFGIPVMPFCVANGPVSLFSVLIVNLPAIIYP
jgi:hypothetical protein